MMKMSLNWLIRSKSPIDSDTLRLWKLKFLNNKWWSEGNEFKAQETNEGQVSWSWWRKKVCSDQTTQESKMKFWSNTRFWKMRAQLSTQVQSAGFEQDPSPPNPEKNKWRQARVSSTRFNFSQKPKRWTKRKESLSFISQMQETHPNPCPLKHLNQRSQPSKFLSQNLWKLYKIKD